MYNFPCTPDCPLEIWADWLEDHGIDPAEIRLLAQGLVCVLGHYISRIYGDGLTIQSAVHGDGNYSIFAGDCLGNGFIYGYAGLGVNTCYGHSST